jgi:hypothetical protein
MGIQDGVRCVHTYIAEKLDTLTKVDPDEFQVNNRVTSTDPTTAKPDQDHPEEI